MKIAPRLFYALALLFSLAGSLSAAEVKVFAAASLTDVLQKIAQDYSAGSSDKISFNFAGSNVLARQIQQGAPADILFSADEAQMNAVAKGGLLVDSSRHDLLANTLVVVAPKDSTLSTFAIGDLAKPEIKRVALADPKTVPAGVYSKEYLTKIGLWTQVEGKVIPLQNVRAALAAVESDNVDVGIVYKTDAIHSQRAKVILEIARMDGPKIVYPIALIKGSANAVAAQKFLDYLGSPAARAVFAEYGFLPGGG
jgi:molybdate transport system substrate-binding protein